MELYKIITVLCLFTNVVEGCRSTPPPNITGLNKFVKSQENYYQAVKNYHTKTGLRMTKGDQREVETYLHLFTTETNPKALAIFITRFHLKMEDLMQQITDRRGNPEFLKKFKETSKEIQTLANATLLTK